MLDLNDLRLFVHIVEQRGILRAGRALGLPKSTVSRRLAALEDQLKTRLIIRSGDDFRLSPAGEEVYRLARGMVDAAREAEEHLLETTSVIAGPVSISVSVLLASCLPRYAQTIAAEHPAITLVLDIADRPIDPAGDGHDLHLYAHHWPLRDTALIQRRICRNPTWLFAAPGHAAEGWEGLDRLADTRLFAFGTAPARAGFEMAAQSGAAALLPLDPHIVSTDAPMLARLAAGGEGVALIPEFAARPHLADGTLVRVLPGFAGPPTMVTLLSPSRRLMNATLRRAADTLGAVVKATILSPVQGVPQMGWPLPNPPRRHFIPLSSDTSSQRARAAASRPGVQHTQAPPTAESEMTMNPLQKVLGAAAVSAAALSTPAAAQDATGPLVLYTNDFEGVITERFEADTGREIDVVQMSGGEILARIAAEASNPQWDVLVFNGSYSFHSLDQQGQLMREVEPANLDNLNEIGRQYLAESRSWFPIGLSASCVILYRTDLVDTPPETFADLTDPRFNGQFGMADPAVAAPAYPCVAQFFESMGIEAAEELFTAYFDNGMRVFRTNGPTGQALVSGDISVALITSQVAYSLIAADEAPLEVVWPAEGAPGVVRGVGIQAQTARPEAAKAFVEWLLEPETQSYLAASVPSDGLFEPTVTGAVRRDDGPAEGLPYAVASDAFAVENEAQIKTWFADRALH